MSIPSELKYSASHEWIRKESDGTVSVGITHHAQEMLGDLVYVENPRIGQQVKKDQECGVVESVKAASDIYAPVSGEVVAINEELSDAPERINENAYDAWMFRLRPSSDEEIEALLDAKGYAEIVEAESD